MFPSHSIRRLWWKELRQLLPLACLLVAVTVVLLALVMLTSYSPSQASLAIKVILLGMPGLFAAGVGGLLVSQEKDQRTIQWLSSLPIPRQDIVRTKAAVSIVSLAMVWLACGLLYMLVSRISQSTPELENTPLALWIIHSLFVLLAGLALAWRFQSPLVSLLLVVPAAFIPYFVLGVAAFFLSQSDGNRWRHEQSGRWLVLANLLFCTAVAAWFVWRNGRRALSPEVVQSSTRWLPFSDRYQTANQSAGYRAIQHPIPALLWQFAMQSRLILLGLTLATLVLVASTFALVESGNRMPVFVTGLVCCTLLATAWLGVIVFQGDNIQNRIRFLADRGVSPSVTWLTRHAIPVSLLALFLAGAIVVVVSLLFNQKPVGVQNILVGIQGLAAFVIVGVGVVLISYLATQWAGQVLPSSIVATLTAPLIALAAIGFFLFATFMCGTPWWMWFLVLPIPAVATWTLMRRWMDRRLGWSYWASHAGYLGTFLLLPMIPFLMEAATEPKMPRNVAIELEKIAKQSNLGFVQPVELVLLSEIQRLNAERKPDEENLDSELSSESGGAGQGGSNNEDDAETHQIASPFSEREKIFDDIERQLAASEGRPVNAGSNRVCNYLRTMATLSHLGAIGDSDDENQTWYRRSVELVDRISQRMRQSPRLSDQDAADQWDIWLLSELKRDGAQAKLGAALYESMVRRLADRDARIDARRQALAVSWHRYRKALDGQSIRNQVRTAATGVNNNYLGDYEIVDFRRTVGTPNQLLSQRRVGRAVADLWELLHTEPGAANPELLERIARFWQQSPSVYGLGKAGGYFRAEDASNFVLIDEGGWWRWNAVANQWSAGWERQAAELLSNLHSNQESNDEQN